MRPGPEIRFGRIEAVAARGDLILRGVIVVGRPHIANKAEIVHLFRQMRPPIGDLDTRLSLRFSADLHRVHRRIDIPDIDFMGGHGAKTLLVKRRFDRVRKGRLSECLAGVRIESGLGIKGFQVAVAPGEKGPDHRFGFRSRCRFGPRGKFTQEGAT